MRSRRDRERIFFTMYHWRTVKVMPFIGTLFMKLFQVTPEKISRNLVL